MAKQFSYMLEYVSAEQRKALEHCVALSLVRQQRDNQSGLVTLVFNIVYAPYIQMRYVEYVFFFQNRDFHAQLEPFHCFYFLLTSFRSQAKEIRMTLITCTLLVLYHVHLLPYTFPPSLLRLAKYRFDI